MSFPTGPASSSKRSIHIYVGNSYEEFSPETYRLHGGGGGAETATIELCNHWGAMGWQVVLWGRAQGEYGNVSCRRFEQWNPSIPCDVFIAWRNLSSLLETRPNARRVVLMMHDSWLGVPVQENVLKRIDDVAAVSRFHAGYLAACHPNLASKIIVFGNGIDPRYWSKPRPKVAHRYFYSNNPSQGLEVLLDQWPTVLRKMPEAELHVAYGFDLPIAIARGMQQPELEAALSRIKRRCETEKGIVLHNRLNNQDLPALQTSSVAWLQPPNDVLHTFCITALEAQLSWCVPVSRTNGALPETLKHFIPWRNPDDLTDILVNAVPNFAPAKLAENLLWANTFAWRHQAERWINHFTRQPADV